MSFLSILKKAVKLTCISFTGIILLYSLLVLGFFNGLGMNPTAVFLFFPCVYVISVANLIVKHTKMSGSGKLFIHFLLFTLSIILFIFIPFGGVFSVKSMLLLFVIYLILYIIGAVIYISVCGAKKKKVQSKDDYQSVYKN